jgi:phage gp37-like protein
MASNAIRLFLCSIPSIWHAWGGGQSGTRPRQGLAYFEAQIEKTLLICRGGN